MQRNFDKLNPEKFYFIPLGGSDEIGMNLNLYYFRGKWLMVDLGISFSAIPGLDVIMPDVRVLTPYLKDLEGLVLTHAHEDHIGAVGYLWEQLKCPLYATPFTASILQQKLKDAGVRAPIHKIPLGGRWQLGEFDLEFITMAHSIPESSALVVRTSVGTMLHTGDWKLDPKPLIGAGTDEAALKRLGSEGVLGVICDSTNVFEEEATGSESDVAKNIKELTGRFPGRNIVFSCFSSNVARLYACAEAAKANGRQPILIGRSLEKIYRAAKACGYLAEDTFLEESYAPKIERGKALWICTGSQGEQRSALVRIASRRHKASLEEGDVVVFSSRIIPGNDRAIYGLHNTLIRQGVQVIGHHDPDGSVHVSGHASRPEITKLYGWLKPKLVIPVHGEARHMAVHKLIAEEAGVPNVLLPSNGSVIEISSEGYAKNIRQVPTRTLALDGLALIPTDGKIVEERLRMGTHGFVQVSVKLQRGSKASQVLVALWGLAEGEDRDALVNLIKKDVEGTCSTLGAGQTIHAMQDTLSRSLRKLLEEQRGKHPLIHVHIVM